MLLTLYIVAIFFFLHFAHCQLKKIRYQYNYNYFFIWPTRIMMYRSVLYYHNRALHTVLRLYFAFILGHIRVPHHLFWRPRIIPIRCGVSIYVKVHYKNSEVFLLLFFKLFARFSKRICRFFNFSKNSRQNYISNN